jgi:signal transduction histidine kinase
MRRLLLSLYIVIAATLVGLVLTFVWLWDHGLRTELLRSAEQAALSAQYFFEAELRGLPVAQWPDRIAEVRRHFGYEVTLLRLAELEASQRNLERLRQGLPAVDEDDDEEDDEDEIKYLLLPLRGSDYVVRVYIVQQVQERAARSVAGFYYLLERQLQGASSRERIDKLRALEQRFQYPIRSVALSEIPNENDRNRVRAGDIVVFDFDGPEERFYKLLPGEDRALQLGPFPRYLLERVIEYVLLLVFASAVGFALYLWVRPLWRDMRGLEQGAEAIGRGKLETRVRVSSRSPIRGVADTFNSMAQRVQELLKAQKEATDAISHELRTPISRMRFGVEMIEHTTLAEDRDRYLQTMRSALDELEALVDESLTYSRLTSAARRVMPQTVELNDWLGEVMDDAQRSAGTIRLIGEVQPPEAVAYFDAVLVTRALKNIIRNALRHARTTVKVVIRQDAQHMDFIVEDDGPGVPTEQRAAIFEPFYRIDNSRQRDSGGHGLGLAIVRRICDWTHAQVSVEDSALGGALFRLRWLTSQIVAPLTLELHK